MKAAKLSPLAAYDAAITNLSAVTDKWAVDIQAIDINPRGREEYAAALKALHDARDAFEAWKSRPKPLLDDKDAA